MSSQPLALQKRMIELEIDGQPVRVFEGQTILDACRKLGIETPTLCYGETLKPVNACRVCVVEVEGARVLVPSCSRKAEAGMKVRTDSERVRHTRKLVLELLGSSVDLSTTPVAEGYLARVRRPAGALRPAGAARPGARPQARRPPRRARRPDGGHGGPAGQGRQRALRARLLASASSVTSASRPAASSTRTRSRSRVAGRGFDARISTEFAVALPDSACVYCGNCIAVCPTGALMFRSEHDLREAGEWERGRADGDPDDLPLLRRRLQPRAARAGQRDRQGDLPADHDVTRGNLCIKGRFGYQYVQGPRRRREE